MERGGGAGRGGAGSSTTNGNLAHPCKHVGHAGGQLQNPTDPPASLPRSSLPPQIATPSPQQVIGISHSLGQHPCRWVVFFSSFLVCIWSKLLLKSHLAAAHRRRSPPRPAWGRGAPPPPRWLHSRRSSAPTGRAGVSAAGAGPSERHGRELLSRRAAPGRRVPGMCRLADVSCGSSAAEQAEQASCYMMQPPSTVFRLKRRLPPKGFWRPRAQAGGPPRLGTHTGRALAHHKGSSLPRGVCHTHKGSTFPMNLCAGGGVVGVGSWVGGVGGVGGVFPHSQG